MSIAFRPRTFAEVCEAMHTGAVVEFDTTEFAAVIVGIKYLASREWEITLAREMTDIKGFTSTKRTETTTVVFYEPR